MRACVRVYACVCICVLRVSCPVSFRAPTGDWNDGAVSAAAAIFAQQHGASADQLVGRTVAGLPAQSSAFATLPPHFERAEDPEVAAAVRACVPDCPAHLTPVLAMALASVVYHRDFLHTHLARDHSAGRARALACVCNAYADAVDA